MNRLNPCLLCVCLIGFVLAACANEGIKPPADAAVAVDSAADASPTGIADASPPDRPLDVIPPQPDLALLDRPGETAPPPVDSAPPDVAPSGSLRRPVAAGSDDSEEWTNATTGSPFGNDTSSGDLEIVSDITLGRVAQVIGLRFTDLRIPQGARIAEAHIQFTSKVQTDANAAEPEPSATSFAIFGQAADSPEGFVQSSTPTTDVSGRPKTSASVIWTDVPRWNAAKASGPEQRTPSLVPVVQQIVDWPGWAPGNAAVFIITGTGTRSASSYDGAMDKATEPPTLVVRYQMR